MARLMNCPFCGSVAFRSHGKVECSGNECGRWLCPIMGVLMTVRAWNRRDKPTRSRRHG